MPQILTKEEAQAFLTAQLAASNVSAFIHMPIPHKTLVYATPSFGVVVEGLPGETYATLRAFAAAYGLPEDGT